MDLGYAVQEGMTISEHQEYLLKEGSRESLNTLFLSVLPYTLKNYGKYKHIIPYDELYGFAYLVFDKVIKAYKPNMGASFATYFNTKVHFELLSKKRRDRLESGRVVSYDVMMNIDDSKDDMSAINMIGKEVVDFDGNEELLRLFNKYIKTLSTNRQEIMKLKVLDNIKNQEEVAEKVGVSQSYISRTQKKVRKEFIAYLIECGYFERGAKIVYR